MLITTLKVDMSLHISSNYGLASVVGNKCCFDLLFMSVAYSSWKGRGSPTNLYIAPDPFQVAGLTAVCNQHNFHGKIGVSTFTCLWSWSNDHGTFKMEINNESIASAPPPAMETEKLKVS